MNTLTEAAICAALAKDFRHHAELYAEQGLKRSAVRCRAIAQNYEAEALKAQIAACEPVVDRRVTFSVAA